MTKKLEYKGNENVKSAYNELSLFLAHSISGREAMRIWESDETPKENKWIISDDEKQSILQVLDVLNDCGANDKEIPQFERTNEALDKLTIDKD